MQTVELFSGTASFSRAAHDLGHETFTVDIDEAFKPDLVKDVSILGLADLPYVPQVLWASPPCQKFSVASISKNWVYENGQPVPKTETARQACSLVVRTMRFIEAIKPRLWFLENPMGMLRVQGFMQNYPRKTVTYCSYGDTRKKPTDIWTNSLAWQPRPICRPSFPCHHQKAPRGSKTGTQGLKTAKERAVIPPGFNAGNTGRV